MLMMKHKGSMDEKVLSRTTNFSLRPKMIVLHLGCFCLKMIVQFICPATNFEDQSQMFSWQTFIIKKSFDIATFKCVSE